MPSNRKKTRKVDGEDKEMKEEKKRYSYWPLTEKTREQVEDIVLKWDTQGLISITQTTSNSNEACWGIVCNACALHANKHKGLSTTDFRLAARQYGLSHGGQHNNQFIHFS